MKKTLTALALAGSIALVGASSAQALYPPLPPAATASAGTVSIGEAFTFSGQGMLPNESVTISVTPVSAGGAAAAGSRSVPLKINVYTAPQSVKTAANGEGKFSASITITETGTYSLLATGDISKVTAGPITVTVVAELIDSDKGEETGAALAATGADSGLVLWTLVGAGALAAGATSVIVVRRRARTNSAV